MMIIPSLLVSGLLAVNQLTASTISSESGFTLDAARSAFDTAREASSGEQESWGSFEIIGCVTVWQAWQEIADRQLPRQALIEALPELSRANAERMERHWRARLEQVSSEEGVPTATYQQDIVDRYNFEFSEAREAIGGSHIQPELVFRAAGACQP